MRKGAITHPGGSVFAGKKCKFTSAGRDPSVLLPLPWLKPGQDSPFVHLFFFLRTEEDY